jgi:phage shock protein PspC (stress-responsive transcriptional regulator)
MAGFANPPIFAACTALKNNYFLIWHGSCSLILQRLCQLERAMEAQENQVALPMRSHTILGVCEAIGEDFGFNPTFLRVPFAAIVLYSPMMAIGAYLALGVVVLASRLLFPKAKAQAIVESSGKAPAANEQQRELARAA